MLSFSFMSMYSPKTASFIVKSFNTYMEQHLATGLTLECYYK